MGRLEGAKGRPREPKRAPRGPKRGPRWPKWGPKWDLRVVRVKLFQKQMVFTMFGASWPSQNDPKMAPNGSLRPKRTSRRAQEDVKTAQVTCETVQVTCW